MRIKGARACRLNQTPKSAGRKWSHRPQPRQQAVTVDAACHITGLGRTMLYLLISKEQLRTVKVGRRRLVLMSSIDELLQPAAANLEA